MPDPGPEGMFMDYSHVIIERLLHLHPKEIDLSLGRIEHLLARLGHPERNLPPVIHVAGTNGKGSTVAYMRAMLEAAGKRVHAYTSPHLVSYHERFRIAKGVENGRGISDFVDESDLAQVLAECERVNDGAPITVFEITTAAGLLLFSRTPADVLLLEVGLGGRFDATNVIDKPLATVITPISIDHVQFLGDTLSRIAFEKAGILKAGVPAIIAAQPIDALNIIESVADNLGTPLTVSGRDWQARRENGRLVFQSEGDTHGGLIDLPPPRLFGEHQFENAGTAIATLKACPALGVSDAAIAEGLKTVYWPARMQRLTGAPFTDWVPEDTEIWLDGGHNPGGAAVLAATLADLEERSSKPLHMICGMLSTKDVTGYLRTFSGLAARFTAVPIPGEQNTIPADDLAAVARDVGLPAHTATDLRDAFRQSAAEPAPFRILICGSLYLAGHVLRLMGDAETASQKQKRAG